MREILKTFATGAGVILVIASPFLVWIGIPMLFMSYDTPEGKAFTTLGTIWIFFPISVLMFFLIYHVGRIAILEWRDMRDS